MLPSLASERSALLAAAQQTERRRRHRSGLLLVAVAALVLFAGHRTAGRVASPAVQPAHLITQGSAEICIYDVSKMHI